MKTEHLVAIAITIIIIFLILYYTMKDSRDNVEIEHSLDKESAKLLTKYLYPDQIII